MIAPSQHGFVKLKSTATQVLSCLNDWSYETEVGKVTAVVYLDIAKAFDKVSHEKLITVLDNKGIRGKPLDWIKDFLTDRTQVVRIQNIFSEEAAVKSGVPQGSCIGPLMFILFINDLVSVVQNCNL